MAHGLSICGSRALECSISSCDPRASLLHGTWDLPGPGLEPGLVSPALAGGFLTTAPLGKSQENNLLIMSLGSVKSDRKSKVGQEQGMLPLKSILYSLDQVSYLESGLQGLPWWRRG